MERISVGKIGENGLLILQSIFLKTISHFANMQKILALNHFVDILDIMHGSSRNSTNMHILSMATRNGQIQDPAVVEVLLEVAQALYDDLDFSNMRKDDYQHPSRLICRFVYMVDHGTDFESHLRFLAQCRGAFSCISELQEILVHSSNNLAVKAMRDGNSSISFVKSCLAFNEVTVPAIPTSLRQLNLYIETAEVALLGGFISHSDGLINAAVNCLPNLDHVNVLRVAEDGDMIISLICKLCAMLVIAPGSLEQGAAWILRPLLSFLDSQSWIMPGIKAKVLLAAIFLSAAQSQNQLPYQYHAVSREVIGNFNLFYGVQSYQEELLLLSGVVLQDIVNIVTQESSKAVRGKIALEACNCVASSFTMSEETLEACSKLVEVAKSCLSAGDKFLQSTLKFLDDQQFHV